MPPNYVPNAFANPGGPATQQAAQSSALRSYTPNPFAGTNPQRVTSMAPHLSVPEASRPYASEIATLREGGYGDQMPDLDKMWRYSPQTYQSQVAEMLRQPGVSDRVYQLQNPYTNPGGSNDTTPIILPTDPATGQLIQPPQYNPGTGEETPEYQEWKRRMRAESGGD